MEIKQTETKNILRLTTPLRACAVIVALAVVGLIVMLVMLAKMPAFQDIVVCKSNMTEVASAIKRYYDVNNKYPANLDDLKKEYIKDKSILKCPLDKSEGDESSYKYIIPERKSKDTFIVLECDRHKLRPDMGYSKIVLYKNGEVEIINPTIKETIKYQENMKKKPPVK